MNKILIIFIILVLEMGSGSTLFAALPFTESFMNSTAPGWTFGGTAALTGGNGDANGDGWLRLTPNAGNSVGHVHSNEEIDPADGLVITFEWASWGGGSPGADGISFFLFDAATPTFRIGDFGGSLGYANGCSGKDGLSRGYMGIALDEWGNFTNANDRCKHGGVGQVANNVSIRGPGDGDNNDSSDYYFETHGVAPSPIDYPNDGTRPGQTGTKYRKVTMLLLPKATGYTVTVQITSGFGSTPVTVIAPHAFTHAPPTNLKAGFGASTGGSKNIHEIRNLSVERLVDLGIAKTSPLDTVLIDAPLTYTITATNIETGKATMVMVNDPLPPNTDFVSAISSQGSCSLVGSDIVCNLGDMIGGATATIDVTVIPRAGGTLTNTATISSSDYDLDPTNNTASREVTVQAATIQGSVFFDDNHDGFLSSGETGTGQTIYVKLVPSATPGGPALFASLADSVTGAYTIGNIPGGTYNIILSTTPDLADVTPSVPTGFLGTNEPDFSIDSLTLSYVDNVDQDFGLFGGSTFSAQVFIDDGSGGGNPNDGTLDSGENPIPAVTIVVTSGGTTVTQSDTDSSGMVTFWLPANLAGSDVSITEQNPGAYISTGAEAGNTNGTYDRATDTLTFLHESGKDYTGVAFGDVPPNTFATNGNQLTPPATPVFYTHTFKPATDGLVSFSATGTASPSIPGWNNLIYLDDDCDGLLSIGQSTLLGPVVATRGNDICIIVKVLVPGGAPQNAIYVSTIAADFAYSGASPALNATYAVVDTTTIGEASGLTLKKAVDKSQAKPGELITYTITYSNEGDSTISNIIVKDETPYASTFQSWSNGPLPPALTIITETLPSVGGTGPLEWTIGGILNPGGSGWISFIVKIE